MERSLENTAQHILDQSDVTGCLFADKHGLCLCIGGQYQKLTNLVQVKWMLGEHLRTDATFGETSAAGDAKPESSGLISAIALHVNRLEPKSNPPIILLENDTQKCIIKQDTKITSAIFRKKSNQEL